LEIESILGSNSMNKQELTMMIHAIDAGIANAAMVRPDAQVRRYLPSRHLP
jgi:hypothetical protein